MNIITLKDFMKADFSHNAELVEELLCRSDLLLLTAPSKTGKSFLAMNLALAICTGKPFLERKTTRSKVLYLQTEIGDLPLQRRFRDLITSFDTSDDDLANLSLTNQRIKIDSSAGLDQLGELIKRSKVDVVILDPLYTLHNSDESKASAVSSMLSNLKTLIKDLNVACFLVHHEGKFFEGKSTNTVHKARGSSAFGDVPDGLLSLSLRKNGMLGLDTVLRNYRSPDPIHLRRSDSMYFEVMNKEDASTDLNFEAELLATVASEPGVSKGRLTELISLRLQKSKSTIHGRIGDLVQMKRLVATKKGKEVTYKVPFEQQQQQHTPLIGCVDDDVEAKGGTDHE